MMLHLSPADIEMCAEVGMRRQAYAERANLRELGRVTGRPIDNHVIGATGEYAVARALGLPWRHNVGTITAPDIGRDIEVRTRLMPCEGDLVLTYRDRDKKDRPYVLVRVSMEPLTQTPRLSPSIGIMGWIFGGDGIRRRYHQETARYKPHGACFVPARHLKPLGTLMAALIAGETWDEHRAEPDRGTEHAPRSRGHHAGSEGGDLDGHQRVADGGGRADHDDHRRHGQHQRRIER